MNKAICRKCYDENIVKHKNFNDKTFWGLSSFDASWEEDIVICPHHVAFNTNTPGTWSVYKEAAFKQCPRKFEHAVADSVNIDKT